MSKKIDCYYHPLVGFGDFVREYNGIYGKGLVIKLYNGREWFAPINEFIIINNHTTNIKNDKEVLCL